MKGDHCSCIALNCASGHKPGECDEPEPMTGGGTPCLTCRSAPEHKHVFVPRYRSDGTLDALVCACGIYPSEAIDRRNP